MYYLGMPRGFLLHADADAFFVSVALRDRPDLIERPVAVVAHVVVACASYPARAFGVRAGMSIQEARHLCADLVLLDVPHEEVDLVGDALFDLFHRFTPAVEPGSIEEAFLALPDLDQDGAVEVARRLRQAAAQELRIPLTIGVGRTKLMAKLASRRGKPDGLSVIDAAEETELRTTLPVADIWGVGGRTAQRLTSLGVTRIADLDRVARTSLQQICGTTMARRLWRIREGTDDAEVRPVRLRSSFSSDGATAGYARPDRSPLELLETCVARVCHRAARVGLAGSKLAITLHPDGSRPLAALKCSVPEATADPTAWLLAAGAVLAAATVPDLIGLGVTLSGLVPVEQVQAALF